MLVDCVKRRCDKGIRRVKNEKIDGYVCNTCGFYEKWLSFWDNEKDINGLPRDNKMLRHFKS